MKKFYTSIFVAVGLAFGGLAPAAHAVAPAPVTYSEMSESGIVANSGDPLTPLAVPAGAAKVQLSTKLWPLNLAAWNQFNGAKTFAYTHSVSIDGVDYTRTPIRYLNIYIPGGSGTSSGVAQSGTSWTSTTSVTSYSSAAHVNMYVQHDEIGTRAGLPGGNYLWSNTLTIDGNPIDLTNFRVEHTYYINHNASKTTLPTSTSIVKKAHTCVDTSGLVNGELLTVVNSNNGVVGANGLSTFKARLDRSGTGSPLVAEITGATTYTYQFDSTVNSSKIVFASLEGQLVSTYTGGQLESLGISVTDSSGDEISVSCYSAPATSPVVNNSGLTVTATYPYTGFPGYSNLYTTYCYAQPPTGSTIGVTGSNGNCTFTTLSASVTYNYYYRQFTGTTLNSATITASGAKIAALGPQGAVVRTFATGSISMPSINSIAGGAVLTWSNVNSTATITRTGNQTYLSSATSGQGITSVESYLVACSSDLGATNNVGSATGCSQVLDQSGNKQLRNNVTETGATQAAQISTTSVSLTTNMWTGTGSTPLNLSGKYLHLEVKITQADGQVYYHRSAGELWGGASTLNNNQVVVVTPLRPVVPEFKQPKFAMPSKIDVDPSGKVKLSGKDMGVNSVVIAGKEQRIDLNSDASLEFETTGLAKGVHDLVMKGAFGTYTIQKAIQVGEAVITRVAGISSRTVGMAGGELSISGQGLEGTTQMTMNGQVLEIVSKSDAKVTFKVPASTVASVNSILIEGSFTPVIYKNAFTYTK